LLIGVSAIDEVPRLFLAHYQTDGGAGSCTPKGTTGDWYAASGASDGYEHWRLDLSAYAGASV
jgi:hypothetical protein